MTLQAGARLGAYEILSPLGAGGMGEVYRARDTRLGRDVAIKVLPETVALDAARLARFEREARALAALNHPNIVTIYAVEEHGGTRFLAMELVEGESLDTIVAAGGLPLVRFFDIAAPLAEALSAAHERGIVHRDLKPGNVMVTHEGRVKVLDFGLARVDGPRSDPNLTDTPTQSRADLTSEGQVFGTVAYMSPEQARGGKVDARSDVFSLGIMLYQMLTGERPFHGESAVDLISSILRDKPPSVTDRRADVPPNLSKVLRRCLEKDARDRYQTSRDVFNELKELRTEIASGAYSSTASAPPALPRRERPPSSPGSSQGRSEIPWIAVLPFQGPASDNELETFADGLAEDITTGLSRFRYLSVVSRASTARLKGQAADVRVLAKELGARYLLEGSVRKSGASIRVSARLIEAGPGTQLWAGTYDRDPTTSGIFAVQDDVAARIVATVADSYGVLVRSMTAVLDEKTDSELSASEWLFQYFAYRQQLTPQAHAALKSRLERAVERDAGQSDLWSCLALVHTDEHAFGFQSDSASLDRALAAARRAVELDRTNPFALLSLAQAHFFRQELAAFRPAAEQAMALNPLNTDALGILGLMIVHTGEFQRGAAIVRRAMELNPSHAGWFHFGPIWEHFERGEYERALDHAMQVNMPGLFWQPLVIAAICGQLGRPTEGAAAVRDLLALDPDFGKHARRDIGVWHFASGLLDRILEGVRNSGLEIVEESGSTVPPPVTVSGDMRATAGFWVAVLPFTHAGGDPDLESFADGLAEDIHAGLAKFPHLSVISRNSTLRLKGQSSDVRAVGQQLGARYVLEGGIRKSASSLRVNVQLIDAQTGAHLWAETYNRDLKGSDVLALQDDMTDRIVATVADTSGALVRSMAASVEEKPDSELTASDVVLRHWRYQHRGTPSEHARVRDGLEKFVEREPGYAAAWACLGRLYVHEFCFGFNRRPEPLERALRAAQRAVDLDPTCQHAHNVIAQVHFFRREVPACRAAGEHAIALNPRDTDTLGVMANLLTDAGDFERGPYLARRAMDLNPHAPDWIRFALVVEQFHKGNYEAALEHISRANMPGFFWVPLWAAACWGLLGRHAEASAAVQELRRLDEAIELHVRQFLDCWLYASGLGERCLEGLRLAGLEIASSDESAIAPAERTPPSPPISGAARADDGFWIAVLPFKSRGGDADVRALGEDLTEEIVTGLSRFSYLKVIARGSTAAFSDDVVDVRAVGRDIGARYVMEGSLRRSGETIRVSVQLVDTVSGAHLWAETYDRTYRPEATFELQDDVVRRVVSTVADTHGVLPHNMGEALRGKPPEELTPYEAVIRGLAQVISVSPEGHASARAGLERAVKEAPGYADAWALLSNMYREEYAHGYNVLPDSLGRALAAARRSVEIAPSNHLAHHALATALFLRREFPAFRSAAERAIALNPMDGFTMAYLASLTAYSGDWERGCAMAKQARDLNPRHPSWYWFSDCFDAYRRGDYRATLDIARRIQMPGFWRLNLALAAAHGQLGERDAAAGALRALLVAKPEFATHARDEMLKWWNDDFVELLMDGLRKAGLESAGETTASVASPSVTTSGAARADEGFWIAVLPFRYGDAASLKTLADGLSEELVAGLSRFSYLRVLGGSSTQRHASQSSDPRVIGNELGARYVMQGSLRQVGGRLRVAVQLVDTTTGAHLWAESYERAFDPNALFEVQDELVPRIVSTVADIHGVLPRSMTAAVRSRPPDQLSPYEAVLRSFSYLERVSAEELTAARSALEQSVRQTPAYADAWAMLALLCAQEYGQGYDLLPDSLAVGAAAARRAVEAGPSNHLAHSSLAQVLFLQKEFQAFRSAAERAIALNPMDGATVALSGILMAYAGDWEHGCAVAERAMRLNPNFPGWYRLASITNAYRKRDYRAALDAALKIQIPGYFWTPVYCAAAYGQLGEREPARKAVGELLAIRPGFGATARREFEKWYDPTLVEHFLDGLRKAGLDVLAADGEAARSAAAAEAPSPVPGPKKRKWWIAAVAAAIVAAAALFLFRSRSGSTREATSGGSPNAIQSLAVLPLDNYSGDPSQDYFAEGMTDELTSQLANISQLRVISRGSAMQFKGKDRPATPVIAKKLGVDAVVEGSVIRAGDKVRITAQLIDARSDRHLWARSFERNSRDILALQDELASAIAREIHVQLTPAEQSRLTQAPSVNPAAYDAYLKGRYYFSRPSDENLKKAIDLFEEATKLDSNYAPAFSGLSDAYLWAAFNEGVLTAAEAGPKAKAAAERAIQLDDSSAEAHTSLAVYKTWYDHDWAGSESEFRRAFALNPNYAFAHDQFGLSLAFQGRFDESVAEGRRGEELDPLNPQIPIDNVMALAGQGQFPAAMEQARRAAALDPTFFFAPFMYGWIALQDGKVRDAIPEFQKAGALESPPFVTAWLGYSYGASGDRTRALATLEEVKKTSLNGYVPPFNLAIVHLGLGDRQRALDYLDQAFAADSQWLIYIKIDRTFDPLRSEPRFQALMKKMRFEK